jgi:hypothetical protein
MAGVTWKMAVLVVVMVIFTILEYQLAEAQSSVCGTQQCASHAYCYRTFSGTNYCRCRSGYKGDGVFGTSYSGCRKRKLRVWKVIVAIIGAAIGALLLLCLCLACIRHCLTRRRKRGPVVQQQGYTQQGAPMGTYETNKVPGPVGVV